MKLRLFAVSFFGACLIALVVLGVAGVSPAAAQRPTPGTGSRVPNFPTPAPKNNVVPRTAPRVASATGPTVVPLNQGRFTHANTYESFQVVMQNTTGVADTFDLIPASTWTGFLFAADGTTLLSDHNGNGLPDLPNVANGALVTVIVKVAVPAGAITGANNVMLVDFRAALDNTKITRATFQLSIPAPFAQVFDDVGDAKVSLQLAQPTNTTTKQYSTVNPPDQYNGAAFNTSVARTPSGGYVYAWNVDRFVGPTHSILVTDIEYTVLDKNGNVIRAPVKLLDNSVMTVPTRDLYPTVAVAPNGRMLITWQREENKSGKYDDYILATVLDATGAGITQLQIDSNAAGPSGFLSTPHAAASGNGQFFIAYERTENPGSSTDPKMNIYYSVVDTNGHFVPPFLPSDTNNPFTNQGWEMIQSVNAINGNDVIITFWHLFDIYYAGYNGDNGTIFAAANLTNNTQARYASDAVQLPNGKVVIAWIDYDAGVPGLDQLAFTVLDPTSFYGSAAASLITPVYNPQAVSGNEYLSITNEPGGRVVMTWMDYFDNPAKPTQPANLYYALVDQNLNSTGTNFSVVTPPIIFRNSKYSPQFIQTNTSGNGNAYYNPFDIRLPYLGR